MNPDYILNAELIGQQYNNDKDLRRHLPHSPKLIPELLFLPHGEKGFLVVGARTSRLINCSAGRQELQRIFTQIDGSKTIAQLENSVTADLEGGIFGVICLLYRYGFLEESDNTSSTQSSPLYSPLESYCGRFMDITRFTCDRKQVVNNLLKASIGIIAPHCVHEMFSATLDDLGVTEYAFINSKSTCKTYDFTHVLHISTADTEPRADLLDALYEKNTLLFLASIGNDKSYLGPFIIPTVSASHHCFRAQIQCDLSGALPKSTLMYWSVYALNELLQLILCISAETYINKVVEHFNDSSARYPEVKRIARVPGGKYSGLESCNELSDEAFYAWLHHSSVRIPPSQYLSPQNHQSHYSVVNLKSYVSPLPKVYGKEKIELSREVSLADELPWYRPVSSPKKMDKNHVAQVLMIAAGHRQIEGEQLRRIAPTGGGLQSPQLVCVCQDIEGLADGVYSYDGPSHTLDKIEVNDIQEFNLCVDPYCKDVPLTLLTIANLERARSKYGDFGYNIVHLDAGVANCFASQVAKSFGWRVRAHVQFDSLHIAKLLKMPTNDYTQIPATIMHIDTGVNSSTFSDVRNKNETTEGMVQLSRRITPMIESVKAIDAGLTEKNSHDGLYSFSKTLLSRRAQQSFSQRDIDEKTLGNLVTQSHKHLDELHIQGALPIKITPWVILPRGNNTLASGIYQTHRDGISQWRRRTQSFGSEQVRECLNQDTFADASLVIVYFADLADTFTKGGAAGYRQLLVQCGSVVGETWLNGVAHGLVGSAFGGIIEAGLKVHTQIDCFREAPIFSLVLGYDSKSED